MGQEEEPFDAEHVHYVPLGSMTPPGADNLLAAGRCIDGDATALSSVRVMGPCIAMGAAAGHALDLAGTGSVRNIDLARGRALLAPGLDEFSVFTKLHDTRVGVAAVPVGHENIAVGSHDPRRRVIKSIRPFARHSRLSQC